MTKIPGLTTEQQQIIREALSSVDQVLIFGSRAKGTHKEFSDVDICLRNSNPIALAELGALREKFQEGPLPFKVDLVDWHEISGDFRQLIEDSALPL